MVSQAVNRLHDDGKSQVGRSFSIRSAIVQRATPGDRMLVVAKGKPRAPHATRLHRMHGSTRQAEAGQRETGSWPGRLIHLDCQKGERHTGCGQKQRFGRDG
jgi:hypothetical protein